MTDNIDWKSYYQQEPIEVEGDVYFKFVCFYMAMTELYDRGLTDEKSRYDRTESFISSEVKESSEWYSRKLYNCIREYIWRKTKIPFDIIRWNKEIMKQYSAQGWIDMFEYFKNEKDEIILDMIKHIWEYGKTRRENTQDKNLIIKNPFYKKNNI